MSSFQKPRKMRAYQNQRYNRDKKKRFTKGTEYKTLSYKSGNYYERSHDDYRAIVTFLEKERCLDPGDGGYPMIDNRLYQWVWHGGAWCDAQNWLNEYREIFA